MKEDFKKTYFYCDIKNEEIFFGDRHYKVPIGSISKFISESDDDWVSIAKELRKIRFKLNEIKSDMDSHKPQQELCNDGEIRVLYDEHELLPEHIDFDMAGYLSGTGENFINYLNLIESIKNLRTGNEESLLRELIFILPIQEKNHVCELKLRHNSVFYYEKVEFLEEDVLPCKNEEEIPNYPNMIDNNSIDIIGHLRESSIWCDLIKLLYTKCELEFIDYLFYNEGILERTIEYIDALLSELFEFQTLKNNIRYATGIDLLKRISPSRSVCWRPAQPPCVALPLPRWEDTAVSVAGRMPLSTIWRSARSWSGAWPG